ncbi:MAG: hypothetical protein IKW74_02720, partial [Thermoguttaceae bacterium]|nr:hypothetical protein [Thermoguttaceae bacterium]
MRDHSQENFVTPASLQDFPVNNPDDELIVAYLDHEMSPEEERTFRARLERSAELQSRLREFEETWHMLETLKIPETNTKLTQTTLEMVSNHAALQLKQEKRRSRYYQMIKILISALFVFAVVAFSRFFSGLIVPDPEAQLKADAPVIDKLDQLETVGDFDFLLLLKESGLFDNQKTSSTDPQTSKKNTLNDFSGQTSNSLSSETDGINRNNVDVNDKITPDTGKNGSLVQQTGEPAGGSPPRPSSERHALSVSRNWKTLSKNRDFLHKQAKFYNFSPEKKNKYRHFYHQIVQHRESENLFHVLAGYDQWFQENLHEIQQDRIKSIDSSSDRMKEVQQLFQFSRYFQNQKTAMSAGPVDFSNIPPGGQTDRLKGFMSPPYTSGTTIPERFGLNNFKPDGSDRNRFPFGPAGPDNLGPGRRNRNQPKPGHSGSNDFMSAQPGQNDSDPARRPDHFIPDNQELDATDSNNRELNGENNVGSTDQSGQKDPQQEILSLNGRNPDDTGTGRPENKPDVQNRRGTGWQPWWPAPYNDSGKAPQFSANDRIQGNRRFNSPNRFLPQELQNLDLSTLNRFWREHNVRRENIVWKDKNYAKNFLTQNREAIIDALPEKGQNYVRKQNDDEQMKILGLLLFSELQSQ